MNKPSKGNWFSRLIALLFAILLFFNANAQGNISSITSTNQVYDEMLYNIPVQVEYDQDKYFVSGYEETVNVHLSSANRIQLDLESNKDTRNFQVVADLTKTPLGTSEIQLRVKGLSTAVTAEIEPKTVTITKEKKVTKVMDVEAQIPESLGVDGYKVEEVNISPKTVKIVTGEETAKAIDRVVAPLSDVKQLADTIKQTVNVQALDNKNQVLSIENPAPQVKVVVDLSLPSKDVGLIIQPTGEPALDVDHYTFSLSKKKVEIRGPQSVLDTIEKIELPLDISKIRSATKRKIKIPINGQYIVLPEEIDVSVEPILKETKQLKENSDTSSLEKKPTTSTGESTRPEKSSDSKKLNESDREETGN